MATEKAVTSPARKLFFGLFVFPLLIAVGMAVLLCSVVLLTNEEETPESLIAAIKTGSPSKRWQKAFELSNELNRGSDALRSQAVLKEAINILGDAGRYDAKTRGYMAMALGRFQAPESVAALTKALHDESAEVRAYSLWSLGVLKAVSAGQEVAVFLKEEDPELRKTGAYVLGALGDSNFKSALLPLLDDDVADVRWNAALALARLGSDAGQAVLIKMLDRSHLAGQDLTESETERVMINAVKGLSLIGSKEARQVLENISKNEKSLKVRQEAINALQQKEK